ncbi:MAG: hypothetical protein P8X43_13145 [Maritimibacter sp.]|jgi:hypothetical protein
MKKILLASTILVGTAGFAAADTANFSFSGAAGFGVAYNITTSTLAPTVNAEFTAGMSTTTDMGLEAGAEVTVTANGIGYDTDLGVTSALGGISDASVYLSGDFGKLTVEYAAANEVDYSYEYVWGDVTLEAGYNWIAGATNDEATATVTYAFGNYEVYAGVNADQTSGAWAVETIDFGASADISGFSLSADVTYDLGLSTYTWEAAAGYASGAYSIDLTVAGDNTFAAFDYSLEGSYDLGGGVSIDAGYFHNAVADSVTAGVSMEF